MSRRKRGADIDVSEYVDDAEVEVELVPEEAPEATPVESPEVKPVIRGSGGEFITRNGVLIQS